MNRISEHGGGSGFERWQAKRRPFTAAEIQSIMSVADPEWQSLIKFGLYTGQRLSDLAPLTWLHDLHGCNGLTFERNHARQVPSRRLFSAPHLQHSVIHPACLPCLTSKKPRPKAFFALWGTTSLSSASRPRRALLIAYEIPSTSVLTS